MQTEQIFIQVLFAVALPPRTIATHCGEAAALVLLEQPHSGIASDRIATMLHLRGQVETRRSSYSFRTTRLGLAQRPGRSTKASQPR